jgi:antitoxin PrlF
MPPTATVTSKGQVTIPQEVRQQLGLHQGDQVEFVTEGGRTFIRPLRSGDNPFEKYVGALGGFETVAEINRWVEDLREE